MKGLKTSPTFSLLPSTVQPRGVCIKTPNVPLSSLLSIEEIAIPVGSLSGSVSLSAKNWDAFFNENGKNSVAPLPSKIISIEQLFKELSIEEDMQEDFIQVCIKDGTPWEWDLEIVPVNKVFQYIYNHMTDDPYNLAYCCPKFLSECYGISESAFKAVQEKGEQATVKFLDSISDRFDFKKAIFCYRDKYSYTDLIQDWVCRYNAKIQVFEYDGTLYYYDTM